MERFGSGEFPIGFRSKHSAMIAEMVSESSKFDWGRHGAFWASLNNVYQKTLELTMFRLTGIVTMTHGAYRRR